MTHTDEWYRKEAAKTLPKVWADWQMVAIEERAMKLKLRDAVADLEQQVEASIRRRASLKERIATQSSLIDKLFKCISDMEVDRQKERESIADGLRE